MSLEELLDTEVSTASKSEEKTSDAPGVITVVTKDELRRFGGRTLKDERVHANRCTDEHAT
jgi:iron complex outermembrane receptor protein